MKLLLTPKLELVVIGGFPHEEKSLVVVIAGDLDSIFGFDTDAGSGVAQASFEPHGSSLERPEKALELVGATGADLAAGCENGAGAERLNAEFMFEAGCFEGIVGCESEGSDKSKRSVEVVLVDCFVIGAVSDAKLKSPRPFDAAGVFSGFVDCAGAFDATTGFIVGFVPVSKNPPPLSGGGDLIGWEAKLDR